MDQFTINLIFVVGTFLIYIAIAVWARAGSTSEFYAAWDKRWDGMVAELRARLK